MYDKYFGLTDKPFSIAPDPRYLFMSEQHREALAHLVYGVGEGGGFVLLTGEVGTGKTTVCRCLLEQLPKNTRIAFILNPKLSATELLANACDELHINYSENPNLKHLTDVLNEFLLKSHAAGLKIVLMIDEAQNLSSEVLEQIRLLTNLETNKEKLLQIILIGQPELKELLARHELRQLAQRITARYHLRPLTAEECESYILHRLEVSGFSDSLFDKKAIKELFRRTGGIPRLINVLCDRAMLGAYARNRRQIGPNVVKQAASEVMGGEVHAEQADTIKPAHTPGYTMRWLSSALAVLLVIASVYVAHLLTKDDDSKQQYLATIAENAKIAQENKALLTKLSILEAEVNAVPKAMLPFLPAGVQPTSRLIALQHLMGRWNIDYQPTRDGDACDYALLNQLRCETESGDWENLNKINRPVIMKLISTTSLPIYGVLLAMDGQNLLMNFSGEEIVLNKNQVSAYWEGDYYLLWQTPPNYQQPLAIWMRGIPVQWLVTSMAKLDKLDLIVPPNVVFDQTLKTRVEEFQQKHSLRADGVAGPHTLITLNSLTKNDYPTLSFLGEAN
ncbi:MAG: AAA family ATPase [Gammaproteobacteria bacterium]|nr:AAA family ATPase [Gammaproteobacteria bacterium]